ncbi:stimulator of interferon genes protein [Eublepharis macularius]|uniref:Stimulator of interferon genes protein n=1 Tax=Eublepharis macularius TaxID=481883 RepID=A0AA97L3V4_EUBMA|nr:stimulator of interferon genes protein [Eublepharis macularius]
MPHEEGGTQPPSLIPRRRGNWAQHARYFFIALCALVLYLTEQSLHRVAQCLIIHFVVQQVEVLLKGICSFTEEVHHLSARYHGKYFRALNACLDFHRHGLLLLLCGAAYLLLPKEPGLPLCLNLSLMCLCRLLTIIFGLQNPSTAEISEICERNNLNVAHGLAWSYYIGYLKIVLPRLKDSISVFNENNRFLLKCKKTWKLHILLPLNCEVYDSLWRADSRIQFINNLPELNVDRAGIKRRTYKNSIYGISDEDQKTHFCVVEYATPLQSLYAMSQDENAAFSRQARLEQAKLFCRTLEEILEKSKECSGCYQLIVYNDSEENDKHFLSKEILRHLKQQNQEEYSMCEKEEGCIPTQASRQPVEETELLISDCDLPLSLHSERN